MKSPRSTTATEGSLDDQRASDEEIDCPEASVASSRRGSVSPSRTR